MPRSRIYLPDINVWLALASRRHVHSSAAAKWLNSSIDARLSFCRITQMGLLRLLTNRTVMGEEALTQSEAWRVYRRISVDHRIAFLNEPPGIEEACRELAGTRQISTNVWTDAYLQAFARCSSALVVTFDRGFARLGSPEALILLS